MRVALIVPEPENTGGVSGYASDLTRLSPPGVTYVVLAQRSGVGRNSHDGHDWLSGSASAIHLPSRKHDFISNFEVQWHLAWNLKSICQKEHIDLVHSQFGHMPDLLVRTKSLGIPIVSTAHNSSLLLSRAIHDSCLSFSRLDQASKYVTLFSSALGVIEKQYVKDRFIIVPSKWFLDHAVRELGIRHNRLFHIPHGVDTNMFKPGSQSKDQEQHKRIVFVGRISAVKGIDVLLSALSILSDSNRSLRLTIVGPGNLGLYRDGISRLKAKGVEVIHTGGVTRDRIASILRSNDIAVSSSYVENAPLSVMEAMSCGIPVVASSVGGIPEVLVHGKTGFLFPAGDHIRLAAILESLLENKDLLNRIGRDARRAAVELFDGAMMCKRTALAYESILSGGHDSESRSD